MKDSIPAASCSCLARRAEWHSCRSFGFYDNVDKVEADIVFVPLKLLEKQLQEEGNVIDCRHCQGRSFYRILQVSVNDILPGFNEAAPEHEVQLAALDKLPGQLASHLMSRSSNIDGILVQHIPVLASSATRTQWNHLREWLLAFANEAPDYRILLENGDAFIMDSEALNGIDVAGVVIRNRFLDIEGRFQFTHSNEIYKSRTSFTTMLQEAQKKDKELIVLAYESVDATSAIKFTAFDPKLVPDDQRYVPQTNYVPWTEKTLFDYRFYSNVDVSFFLSTVEGWGMRGAVRWIYERNDRLMAPVYGKREYQPLNFVQLVSAEDIKLFHKAWRDVREKVPQASAAAQRRGEPIRSFCPPIGQIRDNCADLKSLLLYLDSVSPLDCVESEWLLATKEAVEKLLGEDEKPFWCAEYGASLVFVLEEIMAMQSSHSAAVAPNPVSSLSQKAIWGDELYSFLEVDGVQEDNVSPLEEDLFQSYLESSTGVHTMGCQVRRSVFDLVTSNCEYLLDSDCIEALHPDSEDALNRSLWAEMLTVISSLDRLTTESAAPKEVQTVYDILKSYGDLDRFPAVLHSLLLGGTQDLGGDVTERMMVFPVDPRALMYHDGTDSQACFVQFHAVMSSRLDDFGRRDYYVFVNRDHPSPPALVVWSFLRAKGAPLFLCHAVDSMVDCVSHIKTEGSHEEGSMSIRPFSYQSTTALFDLEKVMSVQDKASFLWLLRIASGVLDQATYQHPQEKVIYNGVVVGLRKAVVASLRGTRTFAQREKWTESLYAVQSTTGASLSTAGAAKTSTFRKITSKVNKRATVTELWEAMPWSSQARDIFNMLCVVLATFLRRVPKDADEFAPLASSIGCQWLYEHVFKKDGAVGMVRYLVLANRAASPFPAYDPHVQMVLMEMRGDHKKFMLDFVESDLDTIGEVVNEVVRQEAVAFDHSAGYHEQTAGAAFASKKLEEPLLTKVNPLTKLKDKVFKKDNLKLALQGGVSISFFLIPMALELILRAALGSSLLVSPHAISIEHQRVLTFAIIHSIAFYGGISFAAAKIVAYNYYRWLITKLAVAQVLVMTVFLIFNAFLLPLLFLISLSVWTPIESLVFIGGFGIAGVYVMLLSLISATNGGRHWSTFGGRIVIFATSLLLVSPILHECGVLSKTADVIVYFSGLSLFMLLLIWGWLRNIKRFKDSIRKGTVVTLTDVEWKQWYERHPTLTEVEAKSLFYEKLRKGLWMTDKLLFKRRWGFLDRDMEFYLIQYDCIVRGLDMPERDTSLWDEYLVRSQISLLEKNAMVRMEMARTLWNLIKNDAVFGTVYMVMIMSDLLLRAWTRYGAPVSDPNAPFADFMSVVYLIFCSVALESVYLIRHAKRADWLHVRSDTYEAVEEATKRGTKFLESWYHEAMASFGYVCLAVGGGVILLALLAARDWSWYSIMLFASKLVGYTGILFGLVHKICIGKAYEGRCIALAAISTLIGLSGGVVANVVLSYVVNAPDCLSPTSPGPCWDLSFTALPITGVLYALLSFILMRGMHSLMYNNGLSTGLLMANPDIGHSGQRFLGIDKTFLSRPESLALKACRGWLAEQSEKENVIVQEVTWELPSGPSLLPPIVETALRDYDGLLKGKRYTWKVAVVPDSCLLSHRHLAVREREKEMFLYMAKTVFENELTRMEAVIHESLEEETGRHHLGVLAELFAPAALSLPRSEAALLPSRMLVQVNRWSDASALLSFIDRTPSCAASVLSCSSVNSGRWMALSPSAREMAIRLIYRLPTDDVSSDVSSVIQSSEELCQLIGCKDFRIFRETWAELHQSEDKYLYSPEAFERHIQSAATRLSLRVGLSLCVMEEAAKRLVSNVIPVGVESQLGSSKWASSMQNTKWIVQHKDQLFKEAVKEVNPWLPLVFATFCGDVCFSQDLFEVEREGGRKIGKAAKKTLCMLHRFASVIRWLLMDWLIWSGDPFVEEFFAKVRTQPSLVSKRVSGRGKKVVDTTRRSFFSLPCLSRRKKLQSNEEPVVTPPGEGGRAEIVSVVGEGERQSGRDLEGGRSFDLEWLQTSRKALVEFMTSKAIPATTAECLELWLLEREPSLLYYFSLRYSGRFQEALDEIFLLQDTIEVALAETNVYELTQWDDLRQFARGGATAGNWNIHESIVRRTDTSKLHVVCLDSGTWPLNGGGVATCRGQLVQGTMERIRWHAIAEAGWIAPIPPNEKIEPNVSQLLVTPLWSPNLGGALENFLAFQSALTVSVKSHRTTMEITQERFCPAFARIIELSRAHEISISDIEDAAEAFTELYVYFTVFDWEKTWSNGAVHECWSRQWLLPPSGYRAYEAEPPALADLDRALELWVCHLMCLQVPFPTLNRDNTGMMHCSHHGPQGLLGVIAKQLAGWSLVVWDHGILWRERALAVSELHSESLFVRSALLGLIRLCSKVVLWKADIVAPCNVSSNVDWEKRIIGTEYSSPAERVEMQRSISPIVNGQNSAHIKLNTWQNRDDAYVTAVMLSHVYRLKDIMNAIYAANAIVNIHGIKCYRLFIYGSKTKDLAYTALCEKAINDLDLAQHVSLMGLAKPLEVLAQGDIFVNSSISEGLPMAIIEAGLAGLPIAATDAGGTKDLVGNFGGVVPPVEPLALGRAQLEVLACSSTICELGGGLPAIDWNSGEWTAEKLTARLLDPAVTALRQRWGSLYRETLIKFFSIGRYCSNHEQQLWIANRMSQVRLARRDVTSAAEQAGGPEEEFAWILSTIQPYEERASMMGELDKFSMTIARNPNADSLFRSQVELRRSSITSGAELRSSIPRSRSSYTNPRLSYLTGRSPAAAGRPSRKSRMSGRERLSSSIASIYPGAVSYKPRDDSFFDCGETEWIGLETPLRTSGVTDGDLGRVSLDMVSVGTGRRSNVRHSSLLREKLSSPMGRSTSNRRSSERTSERKLPTRITSSRKSRTFVPSMPFGRLSTDIAVIETPPGEVGSGQRIVGEHAQL